MLKPSVVAVLFISLLGLLVVDRSEADELGEPRPAEWAQPVEKDYNLYQMSPTLYRSSLPDGGAVPLLTKLRIGTVITFLPESDKRWLSTPGIEQVQLPYRTNHVDDSDILRALRAVKAAEAKGPVLMHCKHGSDRTGLVAAMYRVVVQGWSKEDALNEMTEGGFGDSHHFKDGVRYMMQADVEKLRTALANGDCSTSVFALCSLESWVNSTTTARHLDPQVLQPEH
ncbi:Tyrosine phosphatase family protein [Pseudomonas sp. NFACC23-1]|uniref:phosphatase domain-containing protein n=1 Tax=unclassified Pseudomonas TaxID=196821 RepID=UPI00088F3989|nr:MULTISPECIES: tyrosine-protein phosphatase [unclassified Pseudomonas]SDB56009.1 Tyrosine phosphatase family protein [Pseudomonas sp. NFACC17-2]SEJ77206.1 Tyrosine phosphatase family protein [Pseudomonas sp. NFACC23-1]SFW88871.1 Tyrosine phosphatase family protein [Pseudomonas sp. NFACC16-2]